jgi:hypothetical protein
MAYITQVGTTPTPNANIATALLVHTQTNTTRIRKLWVNVFLDQVAGNGDYIAHITIQRAGAGSAYTSIKTTLALASGVTAGYFGSIPITLNATDVMKVYVIGLAGDTTTPDIVVDVNEEWMDIDASGRVDVGEVLGTAQTAGDLAAMLNVIDDYIDAEIAAISNNVTTILADYARRTGDYSTLAAGAEMGLTDGAITAAKIATAAIDADAIATDALGALELAAGAASEVAVAVWENATRTLTQSAAQVTATVDGSDISIKRGDSISIALTGLASNTGYGKLWFTVKSVYGDADSAAILQVLLTAPAAGTDGLQVLNGAAATAAQASITVNSATAITITIDEAASKELSIASGLVYDVQMLVSGAITTLTEGSFAVTGDVTKAVS